jgi:hypothetical protein
MPTLQEISRHLQGLIPDLSPSFADDIVNQAREDLYAEKEWGFLWTESFIRIPALISAGFCNVTRYSKDIIFNTTARVFLDTIGVDDIEIKDRQFKTKNFEYEYTVVNYDSGTGTGTLNEMYLGESNPIANYEIYKRFILPPDYVRFDGSKVIDFARFEAIVDIKNNYQLWLNRSNSWANSLDSNRTSGGEPFAIIPHSEKVISADETISQYEVYPVPKDKLERIYKVLYVRKGVNLKSNEKFPSLFSKSLLIAAAEIAGYKWANTHKGQFQNLQRTSWENMIALVSARSNPKGYSALLDIAFKRDEELYPKALIESYSRFGFYSLEDCSFDGGYYGLNDVLVVPGVGTSRFKF